MRKVNKVDKLVKPINYSLEKQGLTQSLISNYLTCRKKFLLKIHGYKKQESVNVLFGNIIHAVIAEIYKTKNTESDFIDSEIDKYINSLSDNFINENAEIIEQKSGLAFATLTEYSEHYKKDIQKNKFDRIEEEIKVNFSGVNLRCKIDGMYLDKNKKRWQIEHKTMSQINEDNLFDRLSFDFQDLFYLICGEMYYSEPCSGVLQDIIRQSKSKIHKKETLKDYIKRIKTDIKNRPEYYFIQFEIPFTKRDKENFKKQLIMILNSIGRDLHLNKPEAFFKNSFACDKPFRCEYLEGCSRNLNNYYKDKIFPELDCKY